MFILPKKQIFDGDFYTQIRGYEDSFLHAHEFVEVLIITSGRMHHMLNVKKQTLITGDAILIMPGTEHQFSPPQDVEPWFHRDILFSKEYFLKTCEAYSPTLYEDLIQNKYPLQFKLSPEQFSQLECFISTIVLNKNSDSSLLFSLCTYLINIILSQQLLTSNHPQWITSLISAFENPANYCYTLGELTQNVNFTYAYMCREFKKHIGTTMTEYFNTQKMHYAHALLSTSSLSIEKISELVGINNISHFYKLYKRAYGTTPKNTRSLSSDLNEATKKNKIKE